jgi:hypothetical protein
MRILKISKFLLISTLVLFKAQAHFSSQLGSHFGSYFDFPSFRLIVCQVNLLLCNVFLNLKNEHIFPIAVF